MVTNVAVTVACRNCSPLWAHWSRRDWRTSPRSSWKWSGWRLPWKRSRGSRRSCATMERRVMWPRRRTVFTSEPATWRNTMSFVRTSCCSASAPSCFSSQTSAQRYRPTSSEVSRKDRALKVWNLHRHRYLIHVKRTRLGRYFLHQVLLNEYIGYVQLIDWVRLNVPPNTL